MSPEKFPCSWPAKRPLIGVIGASKASPQGCVQAEKVGRLIAEREGMVVCGGLGGVMEAACRGCCRQGGEAIGILPGAEAGTANPWVSIPILTHMGHARNIIIAHTAQAFIAIEGEYGTLSEMAVALKLDRPVMAIDSWPGLPGVLYVTSPEEAVAEAFARIS
jgi:hypothetical protein